MQIPVSGKTDIVALAGAVAQFNREKKRVELCCIGAAAVFNAGRAVAIARSFLVGDRIGLLERPYFERTEVGAKQKTRIVISLDRYAIR